MNENIKNTVTEEELEGISGGVVASAHSGETNSQGMTWSYEKHKCSKCNDFTVFKMYLGGRGVCTKCGERLG